MFNQYIKELKSSFYNMTAVLYISLILVFTGIFTTVYNLMGRYPTFEYALFQTILIFLIAVPILTMRSFADEKALKTDTLLYSLPVGMTKIVMGKFLALISINAVAVLIVSLYPIIFSFYGTVNFLMTYSNILAYFLLGCALIAVGMFISSLTESVVLSAVSTLGALLLVYFVDVIALLIPGDPWVSLVCFIIIALAVGILVYVFLKNVIIASSVSGVLTVGLIFIYVFKKDILAGLFPSILEKLDVFGILNNFLLGIFDVTAASDAEALLIQPEDPETKWNICRTDGKISLELASGKWECRIYHGNEPEWKTHGFPFRNLPTTNETIRHACVRGLLDFLAGSRRSVNNGVVFQSPNTAIGKGYSGDGIPDTFFQFCSVYPLLSEKRKAYFRSQERGL